MLHRDVNCSSVAAQYLPLEIASENISLPLCPTCNSRESSTRTFSGADYFATLTEKAAWLPGVWTLPSASAISEEQAYQTAKKYVNHQGNFQKHFPDGLFTIGIIHYDIGSQHHPTETYKAVITTVLRKLVGVVEIDAQTGEVLDSRLLNENI